MRKVGRADRLTDLGCLRALCDVVLDDLNLNVVGEPRFHQFGGPGGVTAMYLLAESHLTCHTYPEAGFATFNLYCCRHRDRWPWEAHIREHLGASKVLIRAIHRGAELISRPGSRPGQLVASPSSAEEAQRRR